jgi:hypothetical protein
MAGLFPSSAVSPIRNPAMCLTYLLRLSLLSVNLFVSCRLTKVVEKECLMK